MGGKRRIRLVQVGIGGVGIVVLSRLSMEGAIVVGGSRAAHVLVGKRNLLSNRVSGCCGCRQVVSDAAGEALVSGERHVFRFMTIFGKVKDDVDNTNKNDLSIYDIN